MTMRAATIPSGRSCGHSVGGNHHALNWLLGKGQMAVLGKQASSAEALRTWSCGLRCCFEWWL